MLAIKTDKLTRTYGSHVALDAVDLSVPARTIYGYLGLNGAGKTTTIHILTTLLAPTSGKAMVAGHDVAKDQMRARACIALVGDQGAESRPTWTAREYLGYFANISGDADPNGRVETLLDQVGLERHWRGSPMETYSTGMRRRVEIARALIAKPRVIFLDEPTRGLDLPAKLETWQLLHSIVRESDTTIFLSSHETTEIRELCTQISVLRKGRISYQGATSGLGTEDASFQRSLVDLLSDRAARARSDA